MTSESDGDPFAFTETPFPLSSPSAGKQPLEVLESWIGQLLREGAQARAERDDSQAAAERDKERLLRDLLEVLDAFERVFVSVQRKEAQITPQMQRWLKNFRAAQRLMQSILEHHGVREMDTAAGEFDPHGQEIVEMIAVPGVAEGQILRQDYKGYWRLGKILRKAGVEVAGNSGEEAPSSARTPPFCG